jgi:hypothetical protein
MRHIDRANLMPEKDALIASLNKVFGDTGDV